MTTQQTEYFLQIFKTIGAPLVGAALSRVQDGQDAPKAVAQTVAELLTKSVQLGIDIGAIVELEKQGDKAESARIATTGMAGDMLGGFYALQGRLPEAADMQRITEGLRAVKEFSATFEASADATLRLESIKAKGQAVDALQSQIQVLSAFVPVIEALTNFPLGADPKADMQSIAQTLTQRVTPIAQSLTSSDPDKVMARGLMAGAANLYAQCHEAIGAQSAGQPLDSSKIWQRFDTQLQILEALAQSIVSDSAPAPSAASASPVSPPPASDSAASPAPPASPPVFSQPAPAEKPPEAPAAEQPVKKPQIFSAPVKSPVEQMVAPPTPPVDPPSEAVSAPPPEEPSSSPSVEQSAPPSPPAGAGANPMSFFTAKPPAEERPPAATEQAPPPPPSPPVVPPVEQTPEQPSPQEPEAPKETPPAAAGNPMSFFTKKNQDEEGE